ncbi:hypothetical protein LX64_04224 [Chitinophaga skermanii]|uniref:Pirin family protein n=1 Tax=Chitinophaga skermanii TaxID=331697 RepID=A0A327Q8U3_9BACT|nr:pirin family protein [Chitinophaga skermanii]RAI99682.1 hypothetical protein LX64_04224 [Chitinophaga skermanii]
MRKNIVHILPATERITGEKIIVLETLPNEAFNANPFIRLQHHPPADIPACSQYERLRPHPHRGFALVTFMLQGESFHKDSDGNDAIIKPGDVQYMFAGKGLLHSEGPSAQYIECGGPYEYIQLWLNVPAEHKLDPPTYQRAVKAAIPSAIDDLGVNIRLPMGNYQSMQAPIQTFTPTTALFGELVNNHDILLTVPSGEHTLLYVANGSVTINDDEDNLITEHHLVVFESENNEVKITADGSAQILFLSAMPLQEPIQVSGNFVMNTEEEIKQAYSDEIEGNYGELPY